MLSDQLLPNYLPIKYYRPDIIFVIETQHTRDNNLGDRFRKLIQENIDYDMQYHCANQLASDHNFTKLYEYFLERADEVKKLQADAIILNITGGTKLMAFAAYEALKTICQQVIYTNTKAKQINTINTNFSNSVSPLPQLTIKEYLMAYGVSPQYTHADSAWKTKVQKRAVLTKNLAQIFSQKKNQGFLSAINAMAHHAIQTRETPHGTGEYLKKPEQVFYNPINPECQNILKQYASYGLITYDGRKKITFQSLEAARYMGGFWMEEYVYYMLQEEGIEEIQCGVIVQWDKKTSNELDIIAIHNNRLLIIECKTCKFGKEKTKDNNSVYKLDSIADDLRGLYGEMWLLSACTVPNTPLGHAKSQGITVISGEAIHPVSLKQSIQKWMDKT